MLTADELLAEINQAIQDNTLVLPTLPEVALKVRDVVEDENVSAAKVADVVKTDTALAARLLQVANSPAYRGRNPVDDVQTAITRMGFSTVRNLVTSLVMQQMFQATSEVTDRMLRRTWEHSTEVAAISHLLAKQFTRLKPDQAMLAGLVHDIGVLPILVRAEDMPVLLENPPMLEMIVATLHPRVGKIILESWGFAPEMVAVAAEHEDLKRDVGDKADYVDVVQVANLQAYIGSEHRLGQVDLSTVPAFGKLGLEPDVSIVDIEGGDTIDEMKHALNA